MSTTYQRPFVATLAGRFRAELPLIQVLAGPRQVGKTTGVRQLLAQGAWPHHYANADDVLVSDRIWLLEHWQKALLLGDGALLVRKLPRCAQHQSGGHRQSLWPTRRCASRRENTMPLGAADGRL